MHFKLWFNQNEQSLGRCESQTIQQLGGKSRDNSGRIVNEISVGSHDTMELEMGVTGENKEQNILKRTRANAENVEDMERTGLNK